MEFSVSDAPTDDGKTSVENEALTFEFSVGMPKTALVFEDFDDAASKEDTSVADAAPTDEKKSEPSTADKEFEVPSAEDLAVRTAEDEEFILPDGLSLTGEESIPFGEAEPLIWTTPVLGFTEASEKRYKFIDEEEAKRREQIKRAKIDRSFGRSASYARVDEEVVSHKVTDKSVTAETAVGLEAEEVIAEIDNSDSLSEAVVVNINGNPQDNPDAISVFKFDEEKAPEEKAPVLSEEEIEREKISTLVNRKVEEPEIDEKTEKSEDIVSEDEEKPSETVKREIPDPASPFKDVYSTSFEEELPENERPEG
ncbi:MAG: hypothetical protein J6U68_01870, partial [Clostridia bacterium]|nr:hypothetical protein [Clostridia bacterium]